MSERERERERERESVRLSVCLPMSVGVSVSVCLVVVDDVVGLLLVGGGRACFSMSLSIGFYVNMCKCLLVVIFVLKQRVCLYSSFSAHYLFVSALSMQPMSVWVRTLIYVYTNIYVRVCEQVAKVSQEHAYGKGQPISGNTSTLVTRQHPLSVRERERARQTDRQTVRQMDRDRDRQTGRQTDWQSIIIEPVVNNHSHASSLYIYQARATGLAQQVLDTTRLKFRCHVSVRVEVSSRLVRTLFLENLDWRLSLSISGVTLVPGSDAILLLTPPDDQNRLHVGPAFGRLLVPFLSTHEGEIRSLHKTTVS